MSRDRALVLCALFLAGCAKGGSDQPPAADTTAAAPVQPAPASAPASMAGRWNMGILALQGDSVVQTYVLTATDSTGGWTMTFPNQPPVPMRVLQMSADSVVVEAGPYESLVRQGTQVRTHSVMKLTGDTLHAMTEAHYDVTTADSVQMRHSKGTRAP
jgi:hypothetical protein